MATASATRSTYNHIVVILPLPIPDLLWFDSQLDFLFLNELEMDHGLKSFLKYFLIHVE